MSRFHKRRCDGQILVVALLASALLAGLVFYVANVGDQVNRRVAMQNAADTAAISGASWMARSMNLVAENNVAQTRMLALVPVLDALPLATKMAYEETDAWVQGLEAQLDRPLPMDPVGDKLWDGLGNLCHRLSVEREILGLMDAYFNPNGQMGEPITPLTNWYIPGYNGAPPHGSLWQAAGTLDDFSQATCLSAGVLAQSDAVRWGKAGGQKDRMTAEVAFVVPVLPQLPARRTSFDDFQRPIRYGRIPDEPSDQTQRPKRLGPYDRLFKWRDYRARGIREPDHVVPGTPGHGPIRGGGGSPGGGRTTGSSAKGRSTNPDDHWVYRTVGTILLGYTPYGPYEWMMRRISSYTAAELPDTFLWDYMRKIADIKLGYMWQLNPATQSVHDPNWIVDYVQAKNVAASRKVYRTMLYVVEIRSRYPKGDSAFMSPGSYVTNGERPMVTWMSGWRDPETWRNVRRIADYVWEYQYTYETTEDWDIGIRKQPDPANPQRPAWQKVYMICEYVFGGIDVGGNIEVSNPANYSDSDDLPVPILMDTAVGDYNLEHPHHDLGVRRDVFTYLGVAKRGNNALFWAERFGSGNPYHGVAAVAQAEIFNTTSWDLWTQDWKVKLVPVTDWSSWTDRMSDGVSQAPSTNGMVDPDVVRELQEYFSRFDENMASEMMNH